MQTAMPVGVHCADKGPLEFTVLLRFGFAPRLRFACPLEAPPPSGAWQESLWITVHPSLRSIVGGVEFGIIFKQRLTGRSMFVETLFCLMEEKSML